MQKDDKIKGLLPSYRQKKRIIVFKIESPKKFEFKEISYEILEQLIKFIGAIDLGKGGVWLLREHFHKNKQIGFLRVSTKLKNKVIGALILIRKIKGEDVRVKVLGVSGTLKGAKRFINN